MSQRIQDLPVQDRPRERLLRLGPESLSDAELVGIFINEGRPGENAVQMASRLISELHGLRNMSRATPQALTKLKGLGPAKAATLAAAFELGRRAEQEALREVELCQPEQVYALLGRQLQSLVHEEVHVILLNTRLKLLHTECVFKGGLNSTQAYTREILRLALLHAAYAFILVHNHPSGDPQPSSSDVTFTRKLSEAAALMNLKFADHIIIGHASADRSQPWYSMLQAGLGGLSM
jgi:DNA repair protein RadC